MKHRRARAILSGPILGLPLWIAAGCGDGGETSSTQADTEIEVAQQT